MNHGTACKHCTGRPFVTSEYGIDWCDLCHGTGLTDTNSPTISTDPLDRPLIGVPATTERDVRANAVHRQTADDLMAAQVEEHGKWIGSRLVLPRWTNGEPDYSRD